jgi:hypothetical protein
MNLITISYGTDSKELPKRQFQAKLRNHLLNEIRHHQESEFDRLLKDGHVKKTPDGKIWFVNKERS